MDLTDLDEVLVNGMSDAEFNAVLELIKKYALAVKDVDKIVETIEAMQSILLDK